MRNAAKKANVKKENIKKANFKKAMAHMYMTSLLYDLSSMLPLFSHMSVCSREIETQTDADSAAAVKQIKPLSSSSKQESKGEGKDDDDYDDDYDDNEENADAPNLLAFLKSVTPSMLSELSANLDSAAFDGFILPGGQNADPAAHLYSLTFPHSLIIKANAMRSSFGGGFTSDANADNGTDTPGVECTGVAWNATGSQVIGTFGRRNPPGFCNGAGYLCGWALAAHKFKQGTPAFVYEHSSYLMCVATHPTKPSLMAAGSFNGEVVVVDLASGTPVIGCSSTDDTFHREPVTGLRWVYSKEEGDYQVVSVSGDGKILYWTASKMKCPLRGLQVMNSNAKHTKSTRAVGGVCLGVDESSTDANNTTVYVGSEGGAVIRMSGRDVAPGKPSKVSACSMKWSSSALQALHRIPVQQREEVARSVEKRAKVDKRRGVDLQAFYFAKIEKELLFPGSTEFVYENHVGPVRAIEVSPFGRKIVLTGGDDGEVRVYHTLTKQPMVTLSPTGGAFEGVVNDAKWSKVRPMVFAAADSEGFIRIYDLGKDEQEPVCVLEGSWNQGGKKGEDEGEESEDGEGGGGEERKRGEVASDVVFKRASMHSLAFNGKTRNLIAGGDANGVVHVWRLPGDLVSRNGGEKAEVALFKEYWQGKAE